MHVHADVVEACLLSATRPAPAVAFSVCRVKVRIRSVSKIQREKVGGRKLTREVGLYLPLQILYNISDSIAGVVMDVIRRGLTLLFSLAAWIEASL